MFTSRFMKAILFLFCFICCVFFKVSMGRFLKSCWESLWDPNETYAELKRVAFPTSTAVYGAAWQHITAATNNHLDVLCFEWFVLTLWTLFWTSVTQAFSLQVLQSRSPGISSTVIFSLYNIFLFYLICFLIGFTVVAMDEHQFQGSTFFSLLLLFLFAL